MYQDFKDTLYITAYLNLVRGTIHSSIYIYTPTLQNGLAKRLEVIHKFTEFFEICIEIN